MTQYKKKALIALVVILNTLSYIWTIRMAMEYGFTTHIDLGWESHLQLIANIIIWGTAITLIKYYLDLRNEVKE